MPFAIWGHFHDCHGMTLTCNRGLDTSRQSFLKSDARLPFQILSGGYQIIFKNGKWTQVFGSEAKKKRFGQEDRRGHRSETRKTGKLKRTSAAEIARLERKRK